MRSHTPCRRLAPRAFLGAGLFLAMSWSAHAGPRPETRPLKVLSASKLVGPQVRVLGEPRLAHDHALRGGSIAPDGKRMALLTADWTLHAWDESGEQLWHHALVADREIRGVVPVVFSPAGDRIYCPRLDGSLEVVDADSGRPSGVIDIGEPIVTLVGLPRRGEMVTATRQGSLAFWRIEGGRLVRRASAGAAIPLDAMAVAPAADLLVTRSRGRIQLWAGDTASVTRTIDRTASSLALDISPDGARLALVEDGLVITLMDGKTGQELVKIPAPSGKLAGVRFLENGASMVAWSDWSPLLPTRPVTDLWVYEVPGGKLLREIDAGEAPIATLAPYPGSARFLTGDEDGKARLWDARTVAVFPPVPGLAPAASTAFSTDVTRWAVAGPGDLAEVRTLPTGGLSWGLHTGGEPLAGAWSLRPDDLLVLGRTGRLSLWRRDQPTPDWSSSALQSPVRCAVLSPDGHGLAIGAFGRVVLFDLHRQQVSRTLDVGGGEVADLDFSPQGDALAVAVRGVKGVRLWKSDSSAAPIEAATGVARITALDHDPAGRRLITVTLAGRVQAWDRSAAYLPGPHWDLTTGAVTSVADLGGDALQIAADRFVHQIDLGQESRKATWKNRVFLSARSGGTAIRAMEGSPDGRFLGVINANGTLSLYERAVPAIRPATLTPSVPVSPTTGTSATAPP